mmetsp:Transcript_110925/g.192272  ORF Transcript_110925/g.192272 Transcript_110925/m.192272 type:complete len:223 (-) Transcript_110925:227-895(-)
MQRAATERSTALPGKQVLCRRPGPSLSCRRVRSFRKLLMVWSSSRMFGSCTFLIGPMTAPPTGTLTLRPQGRPALQKLGCLPADPQTGPIQSVYQWLPLSGWCGAADNPHVSTSKGWTCWTTPQFWTLNPTFHMPIVYPLPRPAGYMMMCPTMKSISIQRSKCPLTSRLCWWTPSALIPALCHKKSGGLWGLRIVSNRHFPSDWLTGMSYGRSVLGSSGSQP